MPPHETRGNFFRGYVRDVMFALIVVLTVVVVGAYASIRSGVQAAAREVRAGEAEDRTQREARERRRSDALRWFTRVEREVIPLRLGDREVKEFYVSAPLRSGTLVYFGVTPGYEWIDVYTRKRRAGDGGGTYTGEYDRFGFSLAGRRWSFGDGPPAAREIRELIALLADGFELNGRV